MKTCDEFVIGDENRQRCLLKFATVAIYSQRPKTSKITNVPGWTQARTSIEMDGTLNFDWSPLGGRILA